MSAVAEASSILIDDRLAKRNALVLAVAQALAGGNNTVVVATTGIIGSMLAPDKSLATLPVSVMMIGLWFGTLPIGLLSRNHGRRIGADVPPYVVAEVGLNHGGSLDLAIALVGAAAALGAHAVKLQTLIAAELVSAACPAPWCWW